MLVESLAQGADGAVLAVADAAPEAVLAVMDAHRAADAGGAAALQELLLPLAECVGSRFGVPGIKAAIDLRGWPGGGPLRPPLAALGAEGRAEIGAALRATGVAVS